MKKLFLNENDVLTKSHIKSKFLILRHKMKARKNFDKSETWSFLQFLTENRFIETVQIKRKQIIIRNSQIYVSFLHTFCLAIAKNSMFFSDLNYFHESTFNQKSKRITFHLNRNFFRFTFY